MDLDDVMSWNHAGIAGMKLRPESLLFQPIPDRINAVGHDKGRAFLALGEKVAHRTIEGAGQADDLSFLGHQREGTLDPPDRLSRAAQDAFPRFLDAHIEDAVGSGIGEIYYSLDILAGDGLVHAIGFVFVGAMASPAQPAPAGMSWNLRIAVVGARLFQDDIGAWSHTVPTQLRFWLSINGPTQRVLYFARQASSRLDGLGCRP